MLRRRLPALMLALVLLCVPAQAAKNSTDNFVRTKTYHQNFSDLNRNSVFYDNVTALYEYGLSVGKPDGRFGLTDSLTVGEVLIFAGRIRSLYEYGDPTAGPKAFAYTGQPESRASLRYLQNRKVLGHELDQRLPYRATRAEVAHVLARLLPESALPSIHADLVNEAYATHRILPDVTAYTPYYTDILRLYRTGISQGMDRQGTYGPANPIIRGAAAAMLTRMVDPALRTAPTWYSAAGTTLAQLVPPPDFSPVQGPRSDREMEDCIRSMLRQDRSRLHLQYRAMTDAEARRITAQALEIIKSYCEQSYNTVSCTYTVRGSLVLSFSATAAEGSRLQTLRQEAMESAIAVHDQLWKTGEITASMSDWEKAHVYYRWITAHTVYDHRAGDTSPSHLPWGLFRQRKAVCDGYTGAYNLLLKLEGIPCTALARKDHIWTVAQLDGQLLHIDTTWADMGRKPDDRYFAMTPQESMALHSR